jgi:hypothetical protein
MHQKHIALEKSYFDFYITMDMLLITKILESLLVMMVAFFSKVNATGMKYGLPIY